VLTLSAGVVFLARESKSSCSVQDWQRAVVFVFDSCTEVFIKYYDMLGRIH
jgi:hypothetical protein